MVEFVITCFYPRGTIFKHVVFIASGKNYEPVVFTPRGLFSYLGAFGLSDPAALEDGDELLANRFVVVFDAAGASSS